METISASVRVRYGDEAGWHDTQLIVRPGLLTIVGPYGGAGMRFLPVGRCRCKDLKNWARAAFGRPVLCHESAVVVNEEDKTVTIDPGFPFDEPYVVRVLDKEVEEVRRMKNLWCAVATVGSGRG